MMRTAIGIAKLAFRIQIKPDRLALDLRRRARAFRQAQDAVAAQPGIPYLPFFLEPVALERTLFQDDGLHPTEEAQPLIADYVGRFLHESLLK